MTTRWSAISAISDSRWLETNTPGPARPGSVSSCADPLDALGVEAVGRLVEDQRVRVAEERGGEPEPLAHAEREPADAPPGHLGQPDHRQHLVDPAPARGRLPRRRHQQVVAGRCATGGRRPRRAARPTSRAGSRDAAVRAAVERGRARVGAVEPRSSRIVVLLPDPFGPRKPVTRPGGTVKVEVVDGDGRAVTLGEPSGLDHGGRQ